MKEVWHHHETILCPNCGREQTATVQHTVPFWTRIHNCDCGYTIMESEWEQVETAPADRADSNGEGSVDSAVYRKKVAKLTRNRNNWKQRALDAEAALEILVTDTLDAADRANSEGSES